MSGLGAETRSELDRWRRGYGSLDNGNVCAEQRITALEYLQQATLARAVEVEEGLREFCRFHEAAEARNVKGWDERVETPHSRERARCQARLEALASVKRRLKSLDLWRD
jgi:hypothetical protein